MSKRQGKRPRTTSRSAVAWTRGSRKHYEDSHVQHLVDKEGSECVYAIFDGHGGRNVADFAAAHLPSRLVTTDKAILRNAYLDFDQECVKKCQEEGWEDGCTAVSLTLSGERAAVAHVGDAGAVLCRYRDGVMKAIPLTKDHSPLLLDEQKRIKKAGAFVENGRVNGMLAVSRSLGDAAFKNAGVIASPSIIAFKVTEKEKFLVLACDGLWSTMEPAQVIEFVAAELTSEKRQKYIDKHVPQSIEADEEKMSRVLSRAEDGHLQQIASALKNEAEARGVLDNCTLMIIQF